MPGLNKRANVVILLLLPGIVFATVNSSNRHDIKSKAWTTEYDSYFRKYTKRYFGPGFDWRWFKSQGIAESGLRNNVTSSVGAVGIMQIMPSTYADIHKKSPYLSSGTLTNPRWNIAAGIFYDRILYKRWLKTLDRSTTENDLYMTFASYNAGHGKISSVLKKAKKQTGDVEGWEDIKHHVPSQTRHYVNRIQFLMGKGK
ncbi:MAG: transglycosylase SLT domain-containing protein [Arenicellales bacterium]|jgi:membrane-bound lytic murein transglycosylase F